MKPDDFNLDNYAPAAKEKLGGMLAQLSQLTSGFTDFSSAENKALGERAIKLLGKFKKGEEKPAPKEVVEEVKEIKQDIKEEKKESKKPDAPAIKPKPEDFDLSRYNIPAARVAKYQQLVDELSKQTKGFTEFPNELLLTTAREYVQIFKSKGLKKEPEAKKPAEEKKKPEEKKPEKAGKKRGRPKLSDAEKAARKEKKKPKGKRGRPKKLKVVKGGKAKYDLMKVRSFVKAKADVIGVPAGELAKLTAQEIYDKHIKTKAAVLAEYAQFSPKVLAKFKGVPLDVAECKDLISAYNARRAKVAKKRGKTKSVLEKVGWNVEKSIEKAVRSVKAETLKENPQEWVNKFKSLAKKGAEFMTEFKAILGEKYSKEGVERVLSPVNDFIKEIAKKHSAEYGWGGALSAAELDDYFSEGSMPKEADIDSGRYAEIMSGKEYEIMGTVLDDVIMAKGGDVAKTELLNAFAKVRKVVDSATTMEQLQSAKRMTDLLMKKVMKYYSGDSVLLSDAIAAEYEYARDIDKMVDKKRIELGLPEKKSEGGELELHKWYFIDGIGHIHKNDLYRYMGSGKDGHIFVSEYGKEQILSDAELAKAKITLRDEKMKGNALSQFYKSDGGEAIAGTCPTCENEDMPMGKLGNVLHYRCRACGITYNKPAPETKTTAASEVKPDSPADIAFKKEFSVGGEADAAPAPEQEKTDTDDNIASELANGEEIDERVQFASGGALVKSVNKALEDKKAWKKFEKWEDINEHSKNVVLLAYAVGDEKEKQEALEIWKRHVASDEGISTEDYRRRQELHMKLYPKFVEYVKEKESVKFSDGGQADDDEYDDKAEKVKFGRAATIDRLSKWLKKSSDAREEMKNEINIGEWIDDVYGKDERLADEEFRKFVHQIFMQNISLYRELRYYDYKVIDNSILGYALKKVGDGVTSTKAGDGESKWKTTLSFNEFQKRLAPHLHTAEGGQVFSGNGQSDDDNSAVDQIMPDVEGKDDADIFFDRGGDSNNGVTETRFANRLIKELRKFNDKSESAKIIENELAGKNTSKTILTLRSAIEKGLGELAGYDKKNSLLAFMYQRDMYRKGGKAAWHKEHKYRSEEEWEQDYKPQKIRPVYTHAAEGGLSHPQGSGHGRVKKAVA